MRVPQKTARPSPDERKKMLAELKRRGNARRKHIAEAERIWKEQNEAFVDGAAAGLTIREMANASGTAYEWVRVIVKRGGYIGASKRVGISELPEEE